MDNRFLLHQFNDYINSLDDVNYLYARIASQTAPTLRNIKPSSFVCLTNHTKKVIDIWETYKEDVTRKLKLNYEELHKDENRIWVLLYRKENLSCVIETEENKNFLLNIGYPDGLKFEDCLEYLKARFEDGCPHEIGIFLGYPTKDVLSFIEQKGAGSLLCGYWKVYHDPEQALRVFHKYDLAKAIVVQAIAKSQGGIHASSHLKLG